MTSIRCIQLKKQEGAIVADGILSYQRPHNVIDTLDETIADSLGLFFEVVEFIPYNPSRNGPTVVPIEFRFIFFPTGRPESREDHSIILDACLLVRGPLMPPEENKKVVIKRLTPSVLSIMSFPYDEKELLNTISKIPNII